MTDPISDHLHTVRELLTDIPAGAPLERVQRLAAAQHELQAALDEAMAQAVLDGQSLRTIGAAANLAPNSVPPRLARSRALGSYADPDRERVSLEGVARARHDYRTAAAPLRFQPRTRKGDEHD